MSTAFLSVGIKTDSAKASLRALKSDFAASLKDVVVSINDAALVNSVQAALKKQRFGLSIKLDDDGAKLRADVGKALNEAFAVERVVSINSTALTAQVRAAVQAGLAGSTVAAAAGATLGAAATPDSGNLERVLLQALVPTLDRLSKSVEDGMRAATRARGGAGEAGAEGPISRRRMASRTLGAVDPLTGERVSLRTSVAPDQAAADIAALRAGTGADFGPSRETLLALRDQADREAAAKGALYGPSRETLLRLRDAAAREVDAERLARESSAETFRIRRNLYRAEQAAEAERLRELQAAAQLSAGRAYTPRGARIAGVQAVVNDVGEDRARAFLKPSDRALLGELGNLDQHFKKVSVSGRAFNDIMRDGHSVARGFAGSLGMLWTTYGSTVPLVAAAALGASLRSVFTIGKDVEYQLKFVQVLSGGAAVSMKDFGDAVRGSMATPKEAAEALRGLAQNGLSAQQALRALPTVLQLATAGEMSFAQAALGATGVMTAFNLTVSDLPRVADVFAKAASISNTSVEGMVEAMKQASTVADKYKLSIEEVGAGLAVLAQRNIVGTAAGTAYRNMWVELATPTKRAQEIMKLLGLELYDTNKRLLGSDKIFEQLRAKLSGLNEQSRNMVLQELFNERGEKAANAILSDYETYLQKLEKLKLESQGFVTTVTTGLQDTFQGKLKLLFSEFSLSATDAFTKVSGEAGGFVDKLRVMFGSDEFKNSLATLASGILDLTKALVENAGTVALTFAAWKAMGWAATAVQAIAALKAGIVGLTTAAAAGRVAMTGLMSAATGGLGLIAMLAAEYFLLRDRTDEATKAQDAYNASLNAQSTAAMRSIENSDKQLKYLDQQLKYQREGKSLAEAQRLAQGDAGNAEAAEIGAGLERRKQQREVLRQREAELMGQIDVAPRTPPKLRTSPEAYAWEAQEAARQAKAKEARAQSAEELKNVRDQIKLLDETINAETFRLSTAKTDAKKKADLSLGNLEGERLEWMRRQRDDLAIAIKNNPKLKLGGFLKELDSAPTGLEEFEKFKRDFEGRLSKSKISVALPDKAAEARAAAAARANDNSISRQELSEIESARQKLDQSQRFRRELDEARNPTAEFGPYISAVLAEQRAIEGTTELLKQQAEARERIDKLLRERKNLTPADKRDLNTKLGRIDSEMEESKLTLAHQQKLAQINAETRARQDQYAVEDMLRKLKQQTDSEIKKGVFKDERKVLTPRQQVEAAAALRVESVYQSVIADQIEKVERAQAAVNRLKASGLPVAQAVVEEAEKHAWAETEVLYKLEAQEAIDKARATSKITSSFDETQTMQYGFEKFWAEYRSQGESAATQVYNIMQSTTQGMAQMVGTFVTTGKLHFRSFVASVIGDVARMMASRAIMQFISMMLPARGTASAVPTAADLSAGPWAPRPFLSANGNVMTADGPIPLQRYGTGGIARSPQLSIFGEGSKPEAYVPLPDGRTIPVTVSGGSGSINVTSNVVVNADGKSKVSSDASGTKGAELGRMIDDAVLGVIIREKRPGGILAAA